jgi:hypothetical protein
MPTEQTHYTVSAKEWRSYAWAVIYEACSEINLPAFYRALSGPAILWAVQLKSDFIKQHQPLIMLLLTLGSAVAVFVLEFFFRLFFLTPARLYKKATTAHKEAEAEALNLQKDKENEPRIEMSCATALAWKGSVPSMSTFFVCRWHC